MGSKEEHHDIVIVGGGICGLATALALHRKGINSLVLEKSDTLRAAGAAIGVYINGWRALDQLGLGTELRRKAIPLTEIRDMWLHKNKLQVTSCRKEELRCLKRSDLIETLAKNLPTQSVRFGCQIVAVESDPITSFPVLYTNDGATIKAKVLIGCDGSNSVVAKSLGLQAPKVFPISAVRGFTSYSDGHSFDSHFIRLRGDGVLLGRLPVDEKLVYWFVGRLSPSQDSDVRKVPELIKEFTLETIREFPPEIIEMVKHCDSSSLSLTHIWYRAPWHLLFANFWQGTMTVAGDAMHVMGPFLGQGGSAGLEDAIVLARCLSQEMPMGPEGAISDRELCRRIGRAMSKYVNERRLRVMRLSAQSYLTGSVVVASSWVKKLVCLAILVVFLGGGLLSHTNYDCGSL
ncbi:monooxygenase 1-like isoform X1 [Phoenix dactylifera]|uniref:Monooxygenase 1-like isoform X1 n=2 Tax=Phoenix dactylifera TaxID=42345 RepID=A0A8B9AVC2_PHODC|nr:monooxygenase 1-like isoform X1 [Phoenix dactylifera]